jgi:hypothetical protein
VILADGLDMQHGCKNKSWLFRFCSYIASNYTHMENTFTPERRLEIYKEAQQVLSETGYDNGLCIVLGDIAYGQYYSGPWRYWDQMQAYFTELIHWELLPNKLFTPTQRREILESAIAEVTELINSKA